MLGQVFGFVQRQQRLNDGQALEHALHGGVGGGGLGLPGEAGKLAQEVPGQLGIAGGEHQVFLVVVGGAVRPVVGAGEHVAPVEERC